MMSAKRDSRTVQVVLVGLGGYGIHYLSPLLDEAERYGAELVAGIDPVPGQCPRIADVRERGIPLFGRLEEFFAAGGRADLVVIAAPIHTHADLSCQALAHGAYVLCEKPLCATPREAKVMRNAQQAGGRFLAVGYQWSFSDAIQALKHDVASGLFGKAVRLKTLVSWPRSQAYYARNAWAGRIKTDSGAWVLDSPVNNATAHYLHNMLYLLGSERERSAQPRSVTAELYRAKPIENYDTAGLRVHTDTGTEILFLTTHSGQTSIGPLSAYEFEHAVIHSRNNDPSSFIAQFHDGRVKEYAIPDSTSCNKLWQCVDAVRTGLPVACDVEAAIPHTLCVDAAQKSMPEITMFPDDLVQHQRSGDDCLITVNGLEEILVQCYTVGLLPSELGGIGWARSGRVIDMQEETW
jgi:predicted dehydrogenase